MPNLPDEIVSDILSRLPVVSLCRFRCVSKPWRSLISHPHFIRTHLANKKHERVIFRYGDNLYSEDFESFQFGDESVRAHFKLPTEEGQHFYKIYGSCDGLLLIGLWVRDDEWEYICYYLVNPSTREFRKLPPCPSAFNGNPWKCFDGYGFGYDSQSDDFKVVCISHHQESGDKEASLHDLRTSSWKKIENSPCDHSGVGHVSGVLVRGALHWIGRTSTSNVIVALDLADEKYRTIPTLDCMGDQLVLLGGCLCVSGKWYDHNHADFWVMKEYGVDESWTKFTVTYEGFNDYWKHLSSSRADRVLFQVHNKKFVLFDPQEGKSKELVVHGLPISFAAGTYVESLVSPNRHWHC
ncbi:F-box/kelch-repeat protein At3g06240-like isoform X1 [Rhododendron vialii]|uniref:F-box/kelch-repeat protein At3g06240-like isoform X1 n=1 Tax=Rhododendron vialii TaxID=182163 RepID=UPI0026602B11|nr:F-box/kelch-repeat protein At3g06240-like isoform X1 [Rhododendron vialii]XP_058215571.1 F-box/kelch-repeat protein At3g06240-like isoform X1 [Rhododendron vialii]XP_058215572.1 F-box/kelch-repeat protein At3g06240-like isoform X1 [Rhododendron vialii]